MALVAPAQVFDTIQGVPVYQQEYHPIQYQGIKAEVIEKGTILVAEVANNTNGNDMAHHVQQWVHSQEGQKEDESFFLRKVRMTKQG
ncbi:hypothetical protein [Telluribacter sp.]|jgi:hypothetical protein|uniref:hypothetical protein n=1 Tax=Telluribacter sp. TaxID=1978767 RepID=UPI002E158925|nr:hypothetical protein [Telluribacter sp.]